MLPQEVADGNVLSSLRATIVVTAWSRCADGDDGKATHRLGDIGYPGEAQAAPSTSQSAPIAVMAIPVMAWRHTSLLPAALSLWRQRFGPRFHEAIAAHVLEFFHIVRLCSAAADDGQGILRRRQPSDLPVGSGCHLRPGWPERRRR